MALSGGGHRASLFAVGALLYLADAGKNEKVVSVASVSGGSLTNGYLAQAGSYHRKPAAEVWQVLGSLAGRISNKGTLWTSWLTRAYVVALVASFLATFLVWFLNTHWLLLLALWILALCVWAVAVAGPRGYVAGRAFAKTLFSPKGRPTLLSEVETAIDHVICATHLNAGEHAYFSGNRVYSYRFGWGVPGDFPLHAAVQASAAYPGGFPVRWVRSNHFHFRGREKIPRLMALVDGGVYDNMADQWVRGLANRKDRWGDLADGIQEPDVLIVVSASAGLGLESMRKLLLPGVGEIFALFRVIGVMYDNSSSLRRQELVGQFDQAAISGEGLRGALVHIEQTPFGVPDFFKRQFEKTGEWPDRASRAEAALAHLASEDRDQWKQLVKHNAGYRTTLRRVPEPAAAGLLRHAYVLAMINLHVILDFPLLPLPGSENFEALVDR